MSHENPEGARMTARCDKCKHWQLPSNDGPYPAHPAGIGQCIAVRQRWEIMDPAGIPSDEEKSALLRARAYVEDGEWYSATLYTAADFFCALFEGPAE